MRSMQVLMRDLMNDLARHYDLSEKQVKFLSDSTFLDSFSLSLGVSRTRSQFTTPVSTPFKYLQKRDGIRSGGEGQELEASHLTDQLASIQLEDSCNQKVVQEMVARVQQSTSELEQLQTRLDTLATTEDQDQDQLVSAVNNVDFVGLEAGRL